MTQTAANSYSLYQDAQQAAARNAVMDIPLFPDLAVRLREVTGYGPHVEMLQHFCYWFHPRHPTMRDRWTLYKTYAEWREECGLARKQVDRGRKALRKLGLVIEKKGPHGRIHYRVDWVAVADVLSLFPVGEQTEEKGGNSLEPLEEYSLSPVGEQGQFVPQGERGSLSLVGEHANTGEYAGEYEQETSPLQGGAEPAPPPQIDLEDEIIDLDDLDGPLEADQSAELLDTDKRHSQLGDPRSETTSARAKIDAEERKDRRFKRAALEDPPTPELREALDRYRSGDMDVAQLADTMRGRVYLVGSRACSKLRAEQVAVVLDELELE